MSRLLVLLYGRLVKGWAQEGGGEGPPAMPPDPVFEPKAERVTLDDDEQSKFPYPPSGDWWYRRLPTSDPILVTTREKERIEMMHERTLGEYAKSQHKDYQTMPKVVMTILEHISKDAQLHLEMQPRYRDLIRYDDAEGLWKLIEATFSHVDTGSMVEDVVTWLHSLLSMRQRKDETLPAYLMRFNEKVKSINTFLKGCEIEGLTHISLLLGAGIWMRGLDAACNEARKSIINLNVSGVQGYPESPDEAFSRVSKFRVTTHKVNKDGVIVPTGVSLVTAGSAASRGKPKGNDKKKAGAAAAPASAKDGGKAKEPVRMKPATSSCPPARNAVRITGEDIARTTRPSKTTSPLRRRARRRLLLTTTSSFSLWRRHSRSASASSAPGRSYSTPNAPRTPVSCVTRGS
jgi:hypothetical protein